jgi:hypothetical protein
VQELLCRLGREITIEALDDGQRHACSGDARQSLDRIAQQRRCRAAQHDGWMRIEGDHRRLGTQLLGNAHDVAQDALVAAMDAVEDAQRDCQARSGRQLIEILEQPHPVRKTFTG